jgi:hypothetical protein
LELNIEGPSDDGIARGALRKSRIRNRKPKLDDDLKDEGPDEFVISDSKFEIPELRACKLFRLGI